MRQCTTPAAADTNLKNEDNTTHHNTDYNMLLQVIMECSTCFKENHKKVIWDHIHYSNLAE
jgi:hypothetical protein